MKGKQYGMALVPALLLGLGLLAAAPALAHRAARDSDRATADGTLPAYALDPRTAGDDEGAEEGTSRALPVQVLPRWFGRLVLPGFGPATHDFSLLDALRRAPAGGGAPGARLVLGPGLLAPASTLPPPPPRTGTLRFAVIGDFGDATGPPAGTVATLVHSWAPDLVLTVGDNNYPQGRASTIDANIGQYYHDYIYPYTGTYGPGAPVNAFFPALGNHDWDTRGAVPYLDYFTLPGNERYYDFRQGPVQFFVVDSDSHEPDGYTSTSRQALWLRDRLAASTAPWKIVYLHHAPYSSGSIHGSTVELQWPFQQWGASAVLAGHDHDYERIINGGFPYFVNGLGGCDGCIYSFSTPVAGSVVRYNGDYGALLCDADVGFLTFQFITRTGLNIDSYTLTAPTPGAASPTPTPLPPTATPTAPAAATVTPTATGLPPATTATATATAPAVLTPANTATASPPGDFTVSVDPTSRSVARGTSTTYSVTLAAVNSFTGPVSLSVSNLPSRTTAAFAPNPVILGVGGTATATLTITTQRTGPTGTFSLTINATSGAPAHSSNVTLTITR